MESDSDLGTTITADLPQLISLVQQLQDQFEHKIQYDATKDRLMDTLYNDLQAQREGLHWRILRPLLLDLVVFHDDIGKSLTAQAERTTTPENTRFVNLLTTFQSVIEEILARNGADLFHCPEDTFIPNKQLITKTIATDDPARRGTIATRLRPGFLYEGRVLRPEWVEIFQINGSIAG